MAYPVFSWPTLYINDDIFFLGHIIILRFFRQRGQNDDIGFCFYLWTLYMKLNYLQIMIYLVIQT